MSALCFFPFYFLRRRFALTSLTINAVDPKYCTIQKREKKDSSLLYARVDKKREKAKMSQSSHQTPPS